MFKDVNIKQILKVMLVVLFAAFMLTACDSPKEGKTSLNADKRAALSVKDDSGQQELANQHRECWQTGIIDLLYENMGKVAMGMYAKITDGALPLMMIAFALWTIFRLLKFVGSFTEDSPAEIWNEIVRKLFVCLIYYAFLELGAAILNSTGDGSNFKVNNGVVIKFFQELITPSQPVMCTAPALGQASIESLSFPDGPRTMMNCMICAVNERLTLGFYLSFKVMAAPGFMPLITGLFILLCFTFVKLGFVFYLVDSIYKFGRTDDVYGGYDVNGFAGYGADYQ